MVLSGVGLGQPKENPRNHQGFLQIESGQAALGGSAGEVPSKGHNPTFARGKPRKRKRVRESSPSTERIKPAGSGIKSGIPFIREKPLERALLAIALEEKIKRAR